MVMCQKVLGLTAKSVLLICLFFIHGSSSQLIDSFMQFLHMGGQKLDQEVNDRVRVDTHYDFIGTYFFFGN